ncbi:HNH endonuclease [Lysobacter sp. A289]
MAEQKRPFRTEQSWPDVVDLTALPTVDASPDRAKYWRVLDALRMLGVPSTVAEVTSWLKHNAPEADYSDTRENLTLLTVNDANRRHYDSSRRLFRSDQGHPRDAVFRSKEGRSVRYQSYDLARHGVFDVLRTDAGGFDVVEVMPGELANAYASAQSDVEAETESIQSLADARSKVMRAVVMRRGQREFRDGLLRAYGGRCAISGCAVMDVLEAAHIVPYLGDQTQRTDNGLLLRTDLHTVFDLGRIWIDDTMRVRVAPELDGSEYAALDGRNLSLPGEHADRPHLAHLEQHRKVCRRSRGQS